MYRSKCVSVLLSLHTVCRLGHAIVTRGSDLYNPYTQVGARVAEKDGPVSRAELSKRYLISSFPNLRQVAYLHLPDNVWRPLVIGELIKPQGVATDGQNGRLFVSDPPTNIIWWYKLNVRPDGMLETVGLRKAAVEGYNVKWMTVNGIGDLYFTGRKASDNSSSSNDAVYRQDAINIQTGNSLKPTELFARTNTGKPNSLAWMPAGIAVDSFNVYWSNEEQGAEHGAVIRGSQRQHAGPVKQETAITEMNNAIDSVKGITATGNHIFFLSPDGVYGMSKTTQQAVTDKKEGLIARPPESTDANKKWDPISISWDGGNLLYLTDSAVGAIYMLPAINTNEHNMTRFADAPGVYGVSVIGFNARISNAFRAHGGIGYLTAILIAVVIALS